LTPVAIAQERLLTTKQVEALPYGTPVYGYSTLDPKGLTKFKGRLLSVMHNTIGSGHDWFAIELSSLSVVAGGQSGSPLYVDVKGVPHKIGTLSFAETWQQQGKAVFYATPIHEVLNVSANAGQVPASTSALSRLSASANLRSMLQKLLPENDSLRVMFDTTGTSGVSATGTPGPIIPGSVLGVQLAWGDFDFTSYGTVSQRDGDTIYMFGHPFLQLGPVEYRLVPMKVLTVQQRYDRSYILAVPITGAKAVGVITQDRETAIYGVLGKEPENAIPVSIDLTTSSGQRKTFSFFSVADPVLAPRVIGMGVTTAIQSWSREIGPLTLFMDGKLEIEGAGDVEFSDSFTSITGGPFTATPFGLIASKTNAVLSNRFTKARIKKISVAVKVFDEYRKLSIDSVSLDQPNFKPGETMSLRITLGQPLKETKTVTLNVPLPANLQYGVGKIVVGDASTIDAEESASSGIVNLASLVESLSGKRRPDAIYVYVVFPPSEGGPPGVDKATPMQLGDLTAEVKKTSKRLSSNVEEFQLVVGNFQVDGKKEVQFKVGTASTKPVSHP
jgi:hypothetical protein